MIAVLERPEELVHMPLAERDETYLHVDRCTRCGQEFDCSTKHEPKMQACDFCTVSAMAAGYRKRRNLPALS